MLLWFLALCNFKTIPFLSEQTPTYFISVFSGYSFSVLRTVSATVLRSMVSRLVGKAHQGSGFAIIACAESLSSLIASFLFNGVYSATVNHVRGAVFLMGAGLQVLFTLLSW